MTKPYSSPPTNLRSLRDRLTHVAERQGVVFGRLQRHVAMIVVAQFAAMLTDDSGAPLLLVKGGSSLELRRGIPDSRTSKDFEASAINTRKENMSPMANAQRPQSVSNAVPWCFSGSSKTKQKSVLITRH